MKKIKTAIIGYGRSGRNIQTKALKHLPDLYDIDVYVETNAKGQEMVKQETNKPVLSDYTELYGRNDIDLVINTAFSQYHVSMSRDLLKHGFNVVCEKPVARDPAELQTVFDAAKESGKKYFGFQQAGFGEAFIKLQEIIKSGVLGRILEVSLRYEKLARRWDWQTVHENLGGIFNNIGSHNVNMALILMGFPKDVEVFAFMDRANFSGNAEDYARVLLRAPGAPLFDLVHSHSNAYPTQLYMVQGTNGTLKGDLTWLDWKYYKPDEANPVKVASEPIRNEKGEPVYCSEPLKFYEESWKAEENDNQAEVNEGLIFYRAVHASLTNNEEFPIKDEHLMLQMKVMEAAYNQNKKLFE
jgi:predicted dehydrogenase